MIMKNLVQTTFFSLLLEEQTQPCEPLKLKDAYDEFCTKLTDHCTSEKTTLFLFRSLNFTRIELACIQHQFLNVQEKKCPKDRVC